MKLQKATRRDKRRFKAQHGHRVTGRSVFTIQAVIVKKGQGK
jgi:hypothetical protein